MHWNIENRTKIVERISFKMTFKNYVAIQHHRLILFYGMQIIGHLQRSKTKNTKGHKKSKLSTRIKQQLVFPSLKKIPLG